MGICNTLTQFDRIHIARLWLLIGIGLAARVSAAMSGYAMAALFGSKS